MSAMFNRSVFNQNISNWNVNSVTNMNSMFVRATLFNQDLSAWNVNPNVTSCGSFDSLASSWTLPKPNFTSCTI